MSCQNVFDREPVEVVKERGDVIVAAGGSEEEKISAFPNHQIGAVFYYI